MTARITLTCIWLFAFLLSLILVELYVEKGDSFVLLKADRLDAMKPVFVIYSAYLATILGFWFTKPFKPVKSDSAEQTRFWLAIACALIFNGWVLYMVGRGHFGDKENVLDDIKDAIKIARWFSVVVVPVNVYYFGVKSKNN